LGVSSAIEGLVVFAIDIRGGNTRELDSYVVKGG
jgi:hypothetical protein